MKFFVKKFKKFHNIINDMLFFENTINIAFGMFSTKDQEHHFA